MVTVSAYEVTADTRGFARCSWPATTRAGALKLAHELSVKHADDPKYPGAFWVQTPRPPAKKPRPGLYGEVKFLAKFWRGRRYAPDDTI